MSNTMQLAFLIGRYSIYTAFHLVYVNKWPQISILQQLTSRNKTIKLFKHVMCYLG